MQNAIQCSYDAMINDKETFSNKPSTVALSAILTIITIQILLLFLGKYLWNSIFIVLFPSVKAIQSIWQLVGLSVLIRLLFGNGANAMSMEQLMNIHMKMKVPASRLCSIREYVWEVLLQLEKTIFSNDYGYICKIVGIDKIKEYSLNLAGNDGSMIYDIWFKAICANPQKGDIITCKTYMYENIVFSYLTPLPIQILIKKKENDHAQEQCSVRVLDTQLDMQLNIIKVLAEYIET